MPCSPDMPDQIYTKQRNRKFPIDNKFLLCSNMGMMENSPTPESPNLPTLTPSRQSDGWTIDRQRRFCEALAESGYVERAAGAVGMTRQSAYAFRQSIAGQAFALAWDAALLLARQKMIDDVYELAFEGTVERIWRDGKLVQEKRKRDPKMLLATIERLGAKAALGSAPVQAVQEFGAFLEIMGDEGRGGRGGASEFMECRADWGNVIQRSQLKDSSNLLRRAAQSAPAPQPQLEDKRQI